MKTLESKFVKKILIAKALKRLSIKELAKLSGINHVTMSKILSGEQTIVHQSTFDKLNDWLLQEEKK
ncbi:hypothetical protein [Leuconostoc mesenteroides]|uniref:HTH cro/C1-type domain-containing protein n=1 Tax=Leuconostoc mesenteroides subsp. cremoris ATCC 19254 TaxID=586220 RepID=C2KJI3_LEUMC|nr:hypothetical protein [Leuconostoc mesenteroides]EQC83406.1 hypothetical protein LMT8_02540 [Leuconostoc mesenteroides subsp. cremoris TIFN8]EEJ42585.1 hypothetical protein HMPREF0555_0799 [Leuconostoc mesenteroides subsp. cremoris ATCC 19254]MDG9749954.1 hypothetical protein [Leuconostoc mesenteroides]ORI41190.1 hypothetical protein BMR91_05055 [Leuconostoc mesenteroides subsp. cremoris]ORI44193.1 hypothetical protein BMR93_03050 [Leuconostoc mesenteroides subsp. cremoris]